MQAVVQLNAPPNTPVFTLQARDPDTDHNIHYFIVRDRSKYLVLATPDSLNAITFLNLFAPIPVAAGIRRGSTADRLLRMRFRIRPAAWKSVWCECCVLSGIGLCNRLIPSSEVLPSVCVCVCVCVIKSNSKLYTYSE
jgi:hypothetical protein